MALDGRRRDRLDRRRVDNFGRRNIRFDRADSGKYGRCDAVTMHAAAHSRRYRAGMRTSAPWIAGFIVLVSLWPALCVSSEYGPTSCKSGVFLPLPWGESADTWGMLMAVGAAALAYFAVRYRLRRTRRHGP